MNVCQRVEQIRARWNPLTSTTAFAVFEVTEMEQALECIQKPPEELITEPEEHSLKALLQSIAFGCDNCFSSTILREVFVLFFLYKVGLKGAICCIAPVSFTITCSSHQTLPRTLINS